MPTQLPSEQPAPGVARRSVLRGAAGLGVAGPAAAAGSAAHQAGAEPLVVYLRDAAAGEFEVFHGTRQVRVRNPRLVAQLLDGIATAQ